MFAARRTVRAARILTPLVRIGETAAIGRLALRSDGRVAPAEVMTSVTPRSDIAASKAANALEGP